MRSSNYDIYNANQYLNRATFSSPVALKNDHRLRLFHQYVVESEFRVTAAFTAPTTQSSSSATSTLSRRQKGDKNRLISAESPTSLSVNFLLINGFLRSEGPRNSRYVKCKHNHNHRHKIEHMHGVLRQGRFRNRPDNICCYISMYYINIYLWTNNLILF